MKPQWLRIPASGMVPTRDLFRGARSLAGNLVGTWTAKPLAKAPSFISWVVTERCPLRCQHCDMGVATPEWTRAERQDVAHQIGRTDVWAVSLIGGEPTILADLADCAAVLKGYGKYVSLGTSGIALARHLERLIALELDALVLSVDHEDPSEHEQFRGVPGLSAHLEAAIERVLATRTADKPRLQLRFTINRQNFRGLPAFLARWADRVDHVVLQIVQDNGLHHVRNPAVLFRPEDRPELEAVLAEVGRRWPAVRTKALDLMARYTYEAEQLRRDLGFRCLVVPATQLVILPDGGYKVCWGRSDSAVGSIRTESIESVWNSAKLQAIRRRMQSPDYGCMCWEAACGGNLELLPVARAVDGTLAALGVEPR